MRSKYTVNPLTPLSYISDLLLEAANELPDEREVIEGTEAGRALNLTAMSVRAQVLVFWASPLFNGNTNYASMVDNRGSVCFHKPWMIISGSLPLKHVKRLSIYAMNKGKSCMTLLIHKR